MLRGVGREAMRLLMVKIILNDERLLGSCSNVTIVNQLFFYYYGGRAGGRVVIDIFKNTELMFDQSVKSSVITARLAATHLKE